VRDDTEEKASDRITLKIPRPLYLRLRRVIQGTGFRSEISGYILSL